MMGLLTSVHPTFLLRCLTEHHHLKLPSTIISSTPPFRSRNQEHQHLHGLHSKRCARANLEENYLCILKHCSTLDQLFQVHAHALRTGLFQLPSFQSSLLSVSTTKIKDADMNYARLMFTQIAKPTNFMYNSMIRGYASSSIPERAVFFYRQVRRHGIRLDAFASSFVLKSCSRIWALCEGQQIHAGVVKDGYEPDGFLMTTLLDLYGRCGLADDAQKMFDEMPNRDVVSWNVLISCFLQNKRTRDALNLFHRMRNLEDASLWPDEVTCLLTISACANLGALDIGENVRRYAEDCGFDNALNIRNSLIDMYAKCGCLEQAFKIFDEMPQRNIVTWTTMISAFAMHGEGRAALDAFRAMERAGIQPDVRTFTGILSACSHAGLVDEGRKYFDSMVRDFGIRPTIHHYGCMVDLLGRAGWLDHAYDMIISMGAEPDPTIWRTLLGACRIHGNASVGERVIAHLADMKAQQAGDYVLLSNIYASVGNWDGVAQLRRMMKDEAIMTAPGCSIIELDGEIHEFIVDDNSHPQIKAIHAMLTEIKGQLKNVGYVANVAAELHELDIQAKENVLTFHSEKLAMAFALIRTHPRSPIRIINNLRVCVDCHSLRRSYLRSITGR